MELIDDAEVHPPVGWLDTGLRPVQLHIVHSRGTLRLDVTTAQAAARRDDMVLGGDVGPSSISGQPGFLVRTHEVQLLLTKGELYRFLLRKLLPEEVRRLRKRFGVFFEIDDTFYDQITGEALQPAAGAEAVPAEQTPTWR